MLVWPEALWPTLASQTALLTLILESESWSAPSLVGNDFPSSLYLVKFHSCFIQLSTEFIGEAIPTSCSIQIYSSQSKSNFIFSVP